VVEAAPRSDGDTQAELSPPLVSIGMPVRNAERHLGEAIDSLLAQDYPNFELIISDNASSDRTESICRDYAGRDSRIAYHRSDQDRGAVWNFNQVFTLARGRYFMWAAHDDLRAPGYVSACVAALEDRPDAVLCCTGVEFIDGGGKPVALWTTMIRPTGATARSRMSAIARSRYWLDVYALMRSEVLATTTLAQPVWGFDVSIQLQMCMRGAVTMVPGRLFLYRVDPAKTTHAVAATLGAGASQGAVPVNWSAMTLALLGDVWHSPLGAASRIALVAQLFLQLCVFNGLVGSGVRRDVVANIRSTRSPGRIVALALMAAVVFPVHNRFVRSVVRRRPQLQG
jgi:glycosyltransferase involved in cell wall biosynthesis